jgi:ABC-type Na+ efflux pump permease subunit
MRNALFIGWNDLRRMLRQRETLLWAFVMPLVFFYFFGLIQGGQPGGGESQDELALDAGADGGFLADALAHRLEQRDYAVQREPSAKDDPPQRLVTLPAGFTASVLRGEQVKVRLESSESGNGADFDQFRVGRAVYSLVADLAALSVAEREVTPQALDELARMPRQLTLDVKPAGKRVQIPSGAEQTVPGTLTMFTLIVLLTSGAVSIVIDRNRGLLRRLASTPMSKAQIVFGRWLGILALGLVQVGFGALAGTFLFHVDWGPDKAMVACVLFAWAAFGASAAMWLSSLARTEGQVVGAGVLTANLLAPLGGCWWPIEITPRWMQQLAHLVPTGWVMNALHQLAFFQSGPRGGVQAIALLASGALILGWIATRRFRFV